MRGVPACGALTRSVTVAALLISAAEAQPVIYTPVVNLASYYREDGPIEGEIARGALFVIEGSDLDLLRRVGRAIYPQLQSWAGRRSFIKRTIARVQHSSTVT